jgi:hypothetical protein
LTVTCDVDANPAPFEVQWSKMIPGQSAQFVDNSRTLRLSSVNRTVAGNYSCTAQSQLKVSGKSSEDVSSQAFTYINVQCKFSKSVFVNVAHVTQPFDC